MKRGGQGGLIRKKGHNLSEPLIGTTAQSDREEGQCGGFHSGSLTLVETQLQVHEKPLCPSLSRHRAQSARSRLQENRPDFFSQHFSVISQLSCHDPGTGRQFCLSSRAFLELSRTVAVALDTYVRPGVWVGAHPIHHCTTGCKDLGPLGPGFCYTQPSFIVLSS